MALRQGNYIRVASDSWHFEEATSGKVFVPMGCNYFSKGVGWAPQVWRDFRPSQFEADFAQMNEMGMNVIRVFLTLSSFMPQEMHLSEEYMERCQTMLDIAAKHDIRVIFSGPSAWEGRPAWIEENGLDWKEYFTAEPFLRNLEFFYENFGRKFGTHPALMTYDLYNEPHIAWDLPSHKPTWIKFLQQKYPTLRDLNVAWSGYAQVDDWNAIDIAPIKDDANNPVIWDYQLFRTSLSRRFIQRCIQAIRVHDPNHLIAVGCHQGTIPFTSIDGDGPERYFTFDPHFVGDLLDYISFHWYPYSEELDVNDDPRNFDRNRALLLAAARYAYIGKPVVLQEYGMYNGGTSPTVHWRKPYSHISQETGANWVLGVMEQSKSFCCGWLNWGFHDHLEAKDPTRFQGFFDDNGDPKEQGRRFPGTAARVRNWIETNPRTPGEKTMVVNLPEIITDGQKARAFRHKVMEEFLATSDIEFQVQPTATVLPMI